MGATEWGPDIEQGAHPGRKPCSTPALQPIPMGWGQLLYFLPQHTIYTIYIVSIFHNEHSHSASTFIKLIIYVKYWIICYFYNLKKQTLQEESSDNRKGG